MTRFFATAAILICLAFSVSCPVHSQGKSRNLATDNGCFPWEDFKSGKCVAKPAQAPAPIPEPAPAVAPPPPPLPPIVAAPPAIMPPAVAPPTLASSPPTVSPPCPTDGKRGLSTECSCPAGAHYEAASAHCVADFAAPRPETAPRPTIAIVCDGGKVINGACACPGGFSLMAADNGAGGTCVRTDAENCLGGQLTVSGKCLCNGQVTMSGETYLLEYSRGKCLPMNCPVTALLKNGKCASSSSAEPSPGTDAKEQPETREARESPEESEPRRHCGRGTVYTRSGCVAAHRNSEPYRQYYRGDQFPRW